MINLSLPTTEVEDANLFQAILGCLVEIQRRAVDGTVPPLFVDYKNQRVLIGSVTASGTASLQNLGSSFFVTTTAVNVTGSTAVYSGDITASAFYGDGSQLSGINSGNYILVSTQTITASATSVSFTGLATGTSYQMRLNLVTTGGAGFIRAQINGDSGNNYNSSQTATRNDGAGGNTGNTSSTFILLENEPNTGPQNTQNAKFTIDFTSGYVDGTDVTLSYQGYYTADTTTYWTVVGGGHYKGASNLTSIQIITSAGGIRGVLSLYKIT